MDQLRLTAARPADHKFESFSVVESKLEIGFSTKAFATAPQKFLKEEGALCPFILTRSTNDESSYFGAGHQIAYALTQELFDWPILVSV